MTTWPRRTKFVGLAELRDQLLQHAVVVGDVLHRLVCATASRVSLWNMKRTPQNLLISSNFGGDLASWSRPSSRRTGRSPDAAPRRRSRRRSESPARRWCTRRARRSPPPSNSLRMRSSVAWKSQPSDRAAHRGAGRRDRHAGERRTPSRPGSSMPRRRRPVPPAGGRRWCAARPTCGLRSPRAPRTSPSWVCPRHGAGSSRERQCRQETEAETN